MHDYEPCQSDSSLKTIEIHYCAPEWIELHKCCGKLERDPTDGKVIQMAENVNVRGGSCTQDRLSKKSIHEAVLYTEGAQRLNAMSEPTIMDHLILSMKNLDYLVATQGDFKVDMDGSLHYRNSKYLPNKYK